MSRFSLVDLWLLGSVLMRSGVRIKSGGAAVTWGEECLSACDDRNRLFMSLDNASNAAVVVADGRGVQTQMRLKTLKWQGFFCRRRDRFDPVVFTSLIYPPIVSPSNGRILSKLALFERQWMATLSVGREEMYTQPVSAERIRPISNFLTFIQGSNSYYPRGLIMGKGKFFQLPI